MKLRLVAKFKITPKDPFNFDFSFYKPDHFPTPDTEWVNGKRWQTMLWKGRKLGLVFEDRSKEKFPAVLVNVFHVTGLHKKFLSDLKEEIVWRFNLNLNLLDFYRFAQKDHLLRHVIQKLWGLRPMIPVSKMLDYFGKWGKWKALAVHYVWEEIWWKRKSEGVPWLEKLIRL